MINVKQFFFNRLREHCMVAWGTDGQGVVVDPGTGSDREREILASFLRDEGISLKAILLTHGHFDHFYGVKWLQDLTGVPAYMHPEDRKIIEHSAKNAPDFGMEVPPYDFTTTDVKEGDVISIGEMNLEVIHTPGHSPGGVCYLERNARKIFTGDTLFAGTIGRSDFMFGSYDDLIVSIMEKLIFLDADICIYPGHGGCSSIGYERTHNPFLIPFNEKDGDGSVDGIQI